MKKRLLTGLISSVILAFAISSCQEEKPEIVLPDNDITIENLSALKQTVNEGDSLTIHIKTQPADLLAKKNVSLSILNADSTQYRYAKLSSTVQQKDGTWNVNFQLVRGVKNGDRVMVCIDIPKEDITLYTPAITINFIKEPKKLQTLSRDTIWFNEGDTAQIQVRTQPWNLPGRDGIKYSVLNAKDSAYKYATPLAATMQADSTWFFNLRLEYGMESGDIVKVGITDPDTTMYTAPVILMMVKPEKPHSTKQSVTMVSGETSAYYTGTLARLIFRTDPWDLLFDKENCHVELTDTLGNPIGDKVNMREPKFQADSTWVVEADLKKSITSIDVCVNVVTASDVLRATPVKIRKVSFTLSSVKDGLGNTLEFDNSTMTFSEILPGTSDFSKMRLTFGHTGDKVVVNGVALEKNTGVFDMRQPATVSVWKFDAHKDYTVSMEGTGLPVVVITTPQGREITSKTEWTSDCMIAVYESDGTLLFEDTLSIRGRGNNTWKDFDKKPYALRMDEKHNVLGMRKHKRWCLLANYKDRTRLRNDATFWIARQTGMDYVVQGRFVDLMWNGKYKGNYYLCEQGKIGKRRININEPDVNNPGTGGFLIESDAYYSEESHAQYGGFISKRMKLPYAMKQPDEEVMTKKALDKVMNFINAFEESITDSAKLKNHEYEKYLDVDQCIDYGLVEELVGNHDFYNDYPVYGPHSMYFHVDNIDNGGKLMFGHCWDFDYHTFMPSRSSGWIGMTAHGEGFNAQQRQYMSMEFYYYYLLKDPKFKKRFVERWNLQKDQFKKVTDYIDMMADSIRMSEWCDANMAVRPDGGKGWIPIHNWSDENEDQNLSFQEAVERMKRGFLARWDWIDRNINDL